MRYPIQIGAFGAAWYVGSQMQMRLFPKFSRKTVGTGRLYNHTGVNDPSIYLNNHDLISKFRLFENGQTPADASASMEDYLDIYSSGPLTKAEMLNRLADGRPVDANFASKF